MGGYWCSSPPIIFIAMYARLMWTPSLRSKEHAAKQSEGSIPRHVWQIFFEPPGGDSHDQLRYVVDWKELAPEFEYTLVESELGDEFVRKNFDGETFEIYHMLRNPGMKSDLLRYLILWAEGGYYSDLDTKPVRPLIEWLPADLHSSIRLVIAPEHDDGVNAYGTWPHPVQFCQWTMVAAPGHVALRRMVQRALTGLEDLATAQGVGIDYLSPSDKQVWNATGPPAWTEIIFETIKEAAPEITSYKDLSRLEEPRIFGDILLLPLDAFMTLSTEMRVLKGAGGHQLVHHDFAGAWKSFQE
ncbi:putative initiation-specific alpha-1,6-mannosyltransferase [Paramyrothecium foliicola]|nr:putative initiation-specific alpha-1,6-mannosyltransferase [Paramyrothecium foliicola]